MINFISSQFCNITSKRINVSEIDSENQIRECLLDLGGYGSGIAIFLLIVILFLLCTICWLSCRVRKLNKYVPIVSVHYSTVSGLIRFISHSYL